MVAVGADNQLTLGDGDDTAYVVGLRNIVDAGAGNDSVYVAGMYNALDTGAGNDTVYATGGYTSITDSEGDDTFNLSGLVFNVDSGVGDDTLSVTGDLSSLNAGEGNDALAAAGYANTLVGGAGNDVIVAVGSSNQLLGGEGADVLVGGGQGALAFGQAYGEFADEISDSLGSSAGNVLDGGAGNDILIGGMGNDTLIGGEGDDTYIYYLGEGWDTITDTGGTDVLEIRGGLLDDIFAVTELDVEACLADDGSLFNLTFSADGDDWGSIAFDLEGGDLLETLRLGEGGLEFDLAAIYGDATVVAASDIDGTTLDGAQLDQMAARLDAALDDPANGNLTDVAKLNSAFVETADSAKGDEDSGLIDPNNPLA